MKPILYDKTGKTQLGILEHCINCFTEEERNGAFTLTLTYPISDNLHSHLIYDNIIVVKANDEYDNQQFRIIVTERIIKGTVTVKAVHISYDLVYDFVRDVSFDSGSCEYALNELFRNSHFSTHYRGYSDIINSQKFSAVNKNIWEAIVGSEGSIIDTYAKGPEIIRDNTNIHIKNSRGTDRGVVIEYSVNMLEESLQVDVTGIVTSIYGYARYRDDENNEQVVRAPRIDSGIMNNYAHPFIISKDYTDRFADDVRPTEEQISSLVEADFQNGIDQPKCNYTINFVPLSKCAGYENIQDRIHLCDTVTIKDKRYNIDTKAEVIKYKYNVLLERYDSMELGDARNTLADTIVKPTKDKLQGDIDNKVIIDNKNYPDTLPKSSVISLHAGLGTIQIDWTYENKVYYTYQLYGSTKAGFTPTSADLLYEGQASSFLHTVQAGSTWYYRVRAKNSYGRYNEFSDEVGITCFIIDENTTYIEKAGIQDAYIGALNLDRGWVGELKGHWIDARNLTVTDGNGKRTLDIDSFGNVNLDVTTLMIKSSNIASDTDIKEAIESERNNINESIKDEIIDIENNLGNVLDYIDNAFKDNIIDENEKVALTERILQLEKEKADIEAQVWQLKNYEELVNTNELAELISCESSFNNCHSTYIEYLRNIINAEIQEPVPPVINQEAKMHFIATDHEGACTLIQTSNGKNILIDANEKVTASQIINYLKSINVNKLDMIIVTHYHSDHIGAMPAIMDYATCNGINVYHRQPDWSKMGDKEINEWLTKWYYDEFISKCNSKGVNLITPTEKQRISLGDNEYIEFYNTNNQDYSNYNSLSFGLLYVLGNSKCFLAGDMTYDSENLIGKGTIGEVDLHKTGHHGWDYSTQEWFAKELNAKYNILEALDINNETRKNARSVLQKNNLAIYSLASNGTIIATIKPNAVSLNKNSTDILRDMWWQHGETGDWYWWKNNGQLAKSETLNLGGKDYTFNSSGICTNPY